MRLQWAKSRPNPGQLRLWVSLACLAMILYAASSCPNHLSVLQSSLKQSKLSRLVGPLAVAIIIWYRWTKFVAHRRWIFATFERGNVPSIGRPHLFAGNFFQLFGQPKNLPLIDQYHAELGKTFGLFYGPDPWVISADLQLLKRIFLDDRLIDQTQFRLPFVREINESLAQINGNKWRRTRRILGPSFGQHQMKMDNVFADIQQVSDQFMDFIRAHEISSDEAGGRPRAGSSSGQGAGVGAGRAKSTAGRRVNVISAFKKYSLEVVFRVAYGRQHRCKFVPDQPDELISWIDDGAKQANGLIAQLSIMFAPLRRPLGLLVAFTQLGSCLRYVHSVLSECLDERRRRRPAGPPSSGAHEQQRRMIDTLLESARAGKLADDALTANLFFILVAGYETTSSTLALMSWLLANHQQVQDKLRGELVARNERADYLDWCIMETLRLFPPVPASVGRILEQDFQFKGQKFFKGTSVNASIWTIHHMAEYWGQDVGQFRPERFDESSPISGGGGGCGAEATPDTRAQMLRFFAFGHGPRYCIGKNLAMAEIRNIMTRILLHYRLETSPRTPKLIDASSPNMIHLIVNHPIELKFIKLDP